MYHANFDDRKCNSDQWWSNNKYECEYKKHNTCEKDYIWNPATCSYKNGKDLVNVMNDSVITYDGTIEPYNKKAKPVPTIFNKKSSL